MLVQKLLFYQINLISKSNNDKQELQNCFSFYLL